MRFDHHFPDAQDFLSTLDVHPVYCRSFADCVVRGCKAWLSSESMVQRSGVSVTAARRTLPAHKATMHDKVFHQSRGAERVDNC
jgi:hypothetical protein